MEYESFRDKRVRRLLKKKFGADWLAEHHVRLDALSFSKDPLVDQLLIKSDEFADLAEELENYHLREIEECLSIRGGSKAGTICPVLISIDEQIPLALSGMGLFSVTEGSQSKRVVVVLLVLPAARSTTIVIHGKSADTEYVHAYLSRLRNSFDILNMVEQWMVRCTDHWFLRHDVWNQKSQAQQAEILREILDDTKGLTDELNFSIFDDIRRNMIQVWTTSESTGNSELEVLSREKAKLQHPPCLDNTG